MSTDVSSFKNAYKTAIQSDFPKTAELVLWNDTFRFAERFKGLGSGKIPAKYNASSGLWSLYKIK